MSTKLHPSRPHTYPNRILVVVSGETPQVITETIYALAHAPQPFRPTKTIVVTTGLGQDRAVQALWGTDGQLGKLVSSYKLPDPGLLQENILFPRNAAGVVDEDAHSEEALDRMGNLILTVLREQSAPDCAIHLSLAGGRKSMSYLAGLAVSLVGRPQDRLSHIVLSDPRFERSRNFFFPPKPAVMLELDILDKETGRKLRLSTRDVRVRMVDVPFVRLRELLGENLAIPSHDQPMTELVREANAALTEPEDAVVEFDTYLGIVKFNGAPVHLAPGLYALYYFLARRGVNGLHGRARDEDCIDYLEHYSHVVPEGMEMRKQKRYADRVRKSGEALFAKDQFGKELFDELSRKSPTGWPETSRRGSDSLYNEVLDMRSRKKFMPDVSKTNDRLRRALGMVRAQPFLIQSRHGHYTLSEEVKFVWKDLRPRRSD